MVEDIVFALVFQRGELRAGVGQRDLRVFAHGEVCAEVRRRFDLPFGVAEHVRIDGKPDGIDTRVPLVLPRVHQRLPRRADGVTRDLPSVVPGTADVRVIGVRRVRSVRDARVAAVRALRAVELALPREVVAVALRGVRIFGSVAVVIVVIIRRLVLIVLDLGGDGIVLTDRRGHDADVQLVDGGVVELLQIPRAHAVEDAAPVEHCGEPALRGFALGGTGKVRVAVPVRTVSEEGGIRFDEVLAVDAVVLGDEGIDQSVAVAVIVAAVLPVGLAPVVCLCPRFAGVDGGIGVVDEVRVVAEQPRRKVQGPLILVVAVDVVLLLRNIPVLIVIRIGRMGRIVIAVEPRHERVRAVIVPVRDLRKPADRIGHRAVFGIGVRHIAEARVVAGALFGSRRILVGIARPAGDGHFVAAVPRGELRDGVAVVESFGVAVITIEVVGVVLHRHADLDIGIGRRPVGTIPIKDAVLRRGITLPVRARVRVFQRIGEKVLVIGETERGIVLRGGVDADPFARIRGGGGVARLI